jgi:hypothetical protein
VIHSIEVRYDKAILNFFVFSRFLFLLTLVTFLGFSYVMVGQTVIYSDTHPEDSGEFCDFYLCFMLYSRFHEDMSAQLAFALVMFCFLGIIVTNYTWL